MLKESVEVTTQKSFDLIDFKRMLGVDAKLYIYEWTKRASSKEYDLVISSPSPLQE